MKLHHTLVGLLLDILDWLGLGIIPGIGGLIDIAGTAYFLKVLGPVGATSALEFVPFIDVLPVNIALGLYADREEKPPLLKLPVLELPISH
jgi:hypothetical protein